MFFRIHEDLLKGRQILVIGFGRQGQALARWLPFVGAHVIVTDKRDRDALGVDFEQFANIRFVLGDHPERLLDNTDMICVSGGVSLDLPIIQAAYGRGIVVTNDAQLFVERCPAPIIGITGSAGKTTTTALVGEIFKKAGVTTWIGGNIGNVLLDVMIGIRPEHQVVMELSSFQLELMYTSPSIAAVLNITPNHLDRHGTLEKYMEAKAHILGFQTESDTVILSADDPGSQAMERVAKGDVLWFSQYEMVMDGAFMAGQRLVVAGLASPDGNPHMICNREDITLRGEHNLANVLAACAIAGAAGLEPQIMTQAIQEFKAVPHRLETVRKFNGITYVNDSIATAPERVIAALRSYDEPIILLAGGADKKLSWDDMIVLALHKTRHIFAFGRDGDIVMETVKRLIGRSKRVTRVENLEQAVEGAVEVAQDGDIVLLSPGGTSYDMYQDFAARGDHFRKLVMAL